MISNLIHKSLTTRIAPMVYIMMAVNAVIGLFFVTGIDMSEKDSILYAAGVLVHTTTWGMVLLATSTTALYGMLMKNYSFIKFGGIAGFMAWLFASISLVQGGYWYVFTTVALFHLLFHGYVYLSSSFGYIERVTYEEVA